MNMARRNIFKQIFDGASRRITDLVIPERAQHLLDANENRSQASPEQAGLALSKRRRKRSSQKAILDKKGHGIDRKSGG